MKFPQDFIDRVRESTNIVDLVGQYVQLRRAGGNHQGLCPFHNEKTPSFSVSEQKQVYHCFGCKAGGSVFSFVEKHLGLTFPEAIEYLAKRAGLPLPVASEANDSARSARQALFKVNGLGALFYHRELKNLPPGHEVRKYLEKRRLTDELVDTFKIGYAPEAWSDLSHFLEAKRVPVAVAEQLGLVKRRPNGNGHYDLFRHRLMFPIFSPTGQCLGFGGRVLNPEDKPKYLNSPDSPVFHKGKVFYGLHHSAKYIRTADEVIVVEGYMDWLALAKVEVNNIVATLGTALTHDHARAIKRYTNKILLLFDGDEAGKSAARRSLPILLSQGLFVRGLFLPDELDPDEFIEERGAEALRQLIAGAPDLFDLVSTEMWLQAKGSPTGKIQLLDEFAGILAQVQDPRLKRLYADNLANLVGVDVKLVEQSVRRLPQSPKPLAPVSDETVTEPAPVLKPKLLPEPIPSVFDLSKAPRTELELLNVIFMKEVYLVEALESGVGEQLRDPGAREVFRTAQEVYRQMPNKFDNLSALLADRVRPVETITRYLAEPYTSLADEAAKKLLQDCIKRVKSDYLRSKSKELVSSLRGGGGTNPSDQLEQIMNIHKSRRSLNRDS